MRRRILNGFAMMLVGLAALCAHQASAQSNTTAGTVVSVSGATVDVQLPSGEQTTLMVDGLSVSLSTLEPGDVVTIQYHPMDNGRHPVVTMTLGTPPGPLPGAAMPRVRANGDGIPATTATVEPVKVEPLEMELLDTGMIQLSNVNFDYDQSDIRPDAEAPLEAVGKVLSKWPGLNIQINAYTDSRGTDAYNYDLSYRRSESVRAYLLAQFPQFEQGQLTAKNYGETNPMVPNTTMANMQLNRRVEFVVLNTEVLRQRK